MREFLATPKVAKRKLNNPGPRAIIAMEAQLIQLEGAINALSVIAETMGHGEAPSAASYLSRAAAEHREELQRLWLIAFKAVSPLA
ncbi:hypothetical protein [Azospirillum griseum]|uniref:Uncharacterized protein n=1 Tax=Azospirillum griseum TaxID=2496639 RepID=A0A3S0K8C7_9PROT|nr:hypothetical protein [Azospirillum griseum]RTR24586.1 hypothetical protein EJ903_02190 [Azospirillum griseum]